MGKVAFTHKGWFGLCPAYLGDQQDGKEIDAVEPEGFLDMPVVTARWGLLEYWFDFNVAVVDTIHFIGGAFGIEPQRHRIGGQTVQERHRSASSELRRRDQSVWLCR